MAMLPLIFVQNKIWRYISPSENKCMSPSKVWKTDRNIEEWYEGQGEMRTAIETKPHTCKIFQKMIPWVTGLHFDGRDLNNTIPLPIVPFCPDKVSIALFQQILQFVYVFLTCYNLKLDSNNIDRYEYLRN